MTHSRWASFSLAILSITFVTFALQHCTAQIPKGQLRELETNFLPAWRQGDNFTVLKSLGKVVQKMSDDQLIELDELLAADQIPKSAQVLVEARLGLLRQGMKRQLPRPGLRELLLTLDNIDQEISQVFVEVKAHGDALEKTTDQESFEKYESMIWDSHVLEQKLKASVTLTEYATYVLEAKQRYLKKKLEPEQRELLNKDFTALGKELSDILKAVNERETLVRIKRLKFANNTLTDSKTLKDRYLATWALETDGRLVRETLTAAATQTDGETRTEGRQYFKSPVLNDPDLLADVTQQVEEGVKLAGKDLIKKSGLLFTGLHWWMRGRYGMGSEAYGFLKSTQVLTSDAAMFPLYMPEETPVPTSRSSGSSIPEIDRRHNYIWEWEYRKVTSSFSSASRTRTTNTRRTSETKLSRFY